VLLFARTFAPLLRPSSSLPRYSRRQSSKIIRSPERLVQIPIEPAALTQKEYRLLTEAEWEYAARAGAMTRYSWGDDPRGDSANCDGCGSRWDRQQTAPVGSLKANAFGLHDMLGNVWEWVEDSWHDNYNGAPMHASAWVRGADPNYRVIRGGSWR